MIRIIGILKDFLLSLLFRAEQVKRTKCNSDMLSIKGGAYHARMGSNSKNIELY